MTRVHVVESLPDAGPFLTLCNAQATMSEEGEVSPEGFDFVLAEWARRSNCPSCRAVAGFPAKVGQ